MKRYSKFFAVLLAVAMILPGMAQVAQAADVVAGEEVTRLGGENRSLTSIKVSQEVYKDGSAEDVVLAGYKGSADALTGTLLAAAKDAPLLIVAKTGVTAELKAEIKRLGAKTIHILGGETAVPAAVATELEDLGTVNRIAGEGRWGTAAKIAEQAKDTKHVFLALGRNILEDGREDSLADALAIGPVSAKEGKAVLLTKRNELPEATKKALKDLKVASVTIVGGEGAIAEDVATELKGMDITVDRVAGDNRYDTAAKVAGKYFENPENILLANGRKDADALVGGYLGVKTNAPVLLTRYDKLAPETQTYMNENGVHTYVLGSTAVVADVVVDEVKAAIKGEEVELKVESVSAIEDITVEFGGELKLPETVTATLDNEEATEVTLAIEWAENEEFDAEVAEEYTFTGTLSKVEGEEVEFTIAEDKATVTVKVTVEEEVVEALRVESVSAITTTGVDIVITPLEENKDDVTVKVVNSLEQEVPVKAQNVLAGVTTLNFKFVTPISSAQLDGAWTVDGVKYDFVAIKQLGEINTQAAGTNDVKFVNALSVAGIKNVDNSLLAKYRTALTTPAVSKSLTEVQERIDKVNKDEADADAIVQPVLDAKNQIDLLAALEANFERVNADWIQEYAAGATGSAAGITFTAVGSDNTVWGTAGAALAGTPQENIQDAIDAVNTAKILALTGETTLGLATIANTTATDAEEQAEITALVQEWIANDVAPSKTKANTVKASQILEAIFAVQEADTENGLYSALIALANLDGDNLPAKALNAKIAPFYLSEKPAVASLDTTANIKANLVVKADEKAVDDTVVAIGVAATAIDTAETTLAGSSTAAQKAAFTKELQKLADYTSHETVANKKFLMSTLDEELLVKYAVAMKGLVTTNTVATVQGNVTTVNEAAALDSAVGTINDANSTSAQVRDALIDIAVQRNTGGSATDALAFLNLSAQAKLEVAELVVKNKPAGAIGYANMDAIIKATDGTGAVKTQQAAHAVKVGQFNAIGDLGAATPPTTVETKAALDTYAYAPYKALTNAQKLAVATEINGLTKLVGTTDTPLDFSGDDAVKTLKEANDIIDAAIAAQ